MSSNSPQNDPLAIVVFGGTGDLAKKKLYPALFRLFENGYLPDEFVVIGFARSEFTNADYQQMIHDSLENELEDSVQEARKQFCSHLEYIQGNLKNSDDYRLIENRIQSHEKEMDVRYNRMFYLAIAPSLYSTTFEKLDDSQLGHEQGDYWVRLLIEKPFGNDLTTAQELDGQLSDIFEERQLFRIDHYLAKTPIQNIIAFRFSNFLFAGSWNKEHIKEVHIRMHEDFGVADRGSFYDSVGALRDVGQNHMLQMLALTTMGDPETFDAESIRNARANALKDLRIYETKEKIRRQTTRAQYEGYKDIEGVDEDSSTETYFQVRAYIDNDRWEGVPLYLESGKELAKTHAEIRLVFKEVLPCVCGAEGPHGHENVVTLEMKPDQAIDIRFWAREPGMEYALEEQHMHFSYNEESDKRVPDAYEKILYDSIIGDQTLFARSDEVQASWKFITPIVKQWEATDLHTYPGGADPQSFKFRLNHE